jgi:hypothetical protein
MHAPRVQSAPDPGSFFASESRMLKKYLSVLARHERPEVLDLGPVCGSNVSFFLERCARLHVCDVFSRPTEQRQRECGAESALAYLDFKENSMAGIHVWDAPDHLDNRLLSLLVRKLHTLMKPDGLMMMIASTATAAQSSSHYLVIRDDGAGALEKLTARRLPYFYRTNRDIEQCMKPFKQVNSFLCSSGVREFLFKR